MARAPGALPAPAAEQSQLLKKALNPPLTYVSNAASKAAVINLGRQLAVEMGPRGVRVNSVCPGFFPSRMSRGLLEAAEGGLQGMGRRNPAGRLGGPEDIAGAVVYLASRAGQHVNGAALVVDGGAMWTGGELRGAEAKL